MGDWVIHDGARGPVGFTGKIDVRFMAGDLIAPSTAGITDSWPGFFWRWRDVRVGWFRTRRLPVCDDPAYAPILAYRFLPPPRRAAFELLAGIVASPNDTPVVAPEREVVQ